MLGAGSQAPRFTLASFTLENLSAPVLLAFFKISCPTCQLAFPFLQRLADKSGLRVVGISQDNAMATAEFNQEFGVQFETVVDPARDYAVSNAYGLTTVPSLLLVEPDGRISWTSEGFSQPQLKALAARWNVSLFAPEDRAPVFKPG